MSIPILGMMDDTATVTEAGYKTEIMNAHIVTYTANKMLQFNSTKCKTMKINKSPESVIDQDLKVDNWKASHDKNGVFSEEYGGKATEHKYLGFVISSDASNVTNICRIANDSYSCFSLLSSQCHIPFLLESRF